MIFDCSIKIIRLSSVWRGIVKNGFNTKNSNWHFGTKLHISVDAGTDLVHSFCTMAANVSDVSETCELLHPDDEVVYGDAGYTGVEKCEEIQADLQNVEFRINVKRTAIPSAPDGQKEARAAYIEWYKSDVYNKAEHIQNWKPGLPHFV